MLRTNVAPIWLLVCVALSGCAPPAVPFGASVHWDFKGGFYWTWTRRYGCVAWMAEEDWASVDVLIDSRCEGRRELGHLDGPGINYFSSSDEIVFRDYWPRGEMYGGAPCPYQISDAQIAEQRRVVAEALAEAKTDGERRVLQRIDERLSRVNGNALMTHHGGWCSDLTQQDWDAATPRIRQDTWTDAWRDGR